MNPIFATRIQETLIEIEKAGDFMEIDETAWLIGSIPLSSYAHELMCGKGGEKAPKIFNLLPEMVQCSRMPEAMLRLSSYRNKESKLGRVADLLIRAYS